MIVFVIIKLILLDCCSLASSDAVIGDWKQLNPKGCGVSRMTGELTTDCFVWHSSQVFSKIRGGRNATRGEAPWAVLLMRFKQLIRRPGQYEPSGWCAGSVIANQWVLTAAHCISGYIYFRDKSRLNQIARPHVDLMVVMGYNFTGNAWYDDKVKVDDGKMTKMEFDTKYHNYYPVMGYVHPGELWIERPNTEHKMRMATHLHDIGLLKLDRPITVDLTNNMPYENNICLPTEHFIAVDQSEYGVTAAHGAYEASNTDMPIPLQMAYRKINTMHTYNSSWRFSTYDLDGMSNCKSDSGAPMWQYDKGRAVLVGVLSGGLNFCSTRDDDGRPVPSYYIRVSRYIDWIINVTGLDVEHFAQSGHTPEFDDYWNETINCKSKGVYCGPNEIPG